MVILCPNCQTENANTRVACLSCGANLHLTVEVPSVNNDHESSAMSENPEIEDKLDQTQMVVTDDDEAIENDAPVVDKSDESDDEVTYATTKMPNMNDEDGLLHIGSVRFRGNLVLKDKETGIIYHIQNDQLNEAVVGRYNAQTGYSPVVDFTDQDGKKRGVSRRHATINQRGELIFVTDHNSLNGTYLNGQRLVPEQARVMRDSDSLRVGHVSLIVIFEDVE